MKKLLTLSCAVCALSGSVALSQDLVFEPGDDDRFDWDSYNALKSDEFAGQSIRVFGPWLGQDRVLVESVIDYFEAATGITVDYSGSDSFEQQVVIDAEAGSPPDIGVFPQPGLAAELARKGQLKPLAEGTEHWIVDNYAAGESWAQYGNYLGPDGETHQYGFPFKADVKSLVWYVPENFEDAGYEVPETMEDLKTLTEQIAEDGETPWCIGLGSGGATGWPATDWVEDMMLRNNSPEDYDAWVKNELPFDDPKVIAAIEDYGWFSRQDDFVSGGAQAIASIDFRDSPKGLFDFPPQCYLHKQASFIPSFFPDGVEIGTDVDFFYLPAYADKDLGQPVLGAGTIFAQLTDNPVNAAFFEFLESPIAHEVWMAQRGFLTPYTKANADVYGDPTLKKMGDILTSATTFRFDGSDLMPGSIGAGAFWTGMVDYASGKSARDVAQQIQQQWNTLK
ncbi:carbohydrate ABC transporter substrate-binding protein [Rhodobacteraceae bacterium]|nr:carbohydrate ABC transporter substrate-binding protein [Paracoccaceae bacterium]